MLSIGHLTASLSDKGSGVKMVVEQLSAEAYAAGHRVKVFGFDESGSETWRGGPAAKFPLRGPAALGYAPSMEAALEEFRPEIIHAHGLWLLFARAALRQKRISGSPYLVSPHGMLAKIALQIKPWRKRIASALYQEQVLRQADCLVATSENELNHIRDAGLPGPVAIIPLGIEESPPALKFTDVGEKRVTYLGRKLALKGLEDLVLAWKQIAQHFPDWRLQLIGPDSGGYEAHLAQVIAYEKIPRIDLLPPVFGAAREAAYCESQITILPSKTENFALTVGESLVRGVPVISTHATPWAGLKSESCGLWIDGNRRSIVEGLEQMMSLSAAERFAMGERGRNWMLRDYRWSVVAERHHQLYRWILKQDDRPNFVVVE